MMALVPALGPARPDDGTDTGGRDIWRSRVPASRRWSRPWRCFSVRRSPPSSTSYVLSDTTGKGVEVTQVDPATGNSVGSALTLHALQRFDAVGGQLGRVSFFPVGQIQRINPPVPISQSPNVADANNGQI